MADQPVSGHVHAGDRRPASARVELGLLDVAPDAVLAVDGEGRVALLNAAAERLLGVDRATVLGRAAATVLPAASAVLRPGDDPVDTMALGDGGREVPVELRASDAGDGLVLAVLRDSTHRRAVEEELRRSRRRLAEAESLARIGSWEWDIPGNRVTWSDELYRIYGHEPGAFVPTYERFLEHVHEDDREAVDARNHKAFADHQPFEDIKRVLRADGTEFLMRTQGEVICDETGAPLRMLGVCEDVTAEVRAAEAQALLAAVVNSSSDAISTRDAKGRVTSWNPAAEELYGRSAAEALGRPIDAALPPGHHERDREALARALRGAAVQHVDTRRLRPDGTTVEVSVTMSPLLGPDGEVLGVSEIARDVTERRRFEERLKWLGDHDALTGLANRRRFEDELRTHCARAARSGETSAVVVLDLDSFKYVNDSTGHTAGDQLIRSVAMALAQRVRSADVLARLGGDEFAVLLHAVNEEGALASANALLEAVRHQATVIGGRALRATASIGVVLHDPAVNVGAEGLLAAADRAMYEAKDAGRDRVVLHTADRVQAARTRQRTSWEHRINAALAGDGFVLEAQPIVDAATGRVHQHELLLRMRDESGPEGALTPPAAFLGVAERLGLIHAIDRWVAQQAVHLLAEHPAARLCVNLSGRSIDDAGFPAVIAGALDGSGVDPTRLVFEITETAAITNMDEARRFADRLTGLGCRFALDDFGTGFGSFSYLKHLPVDELKIDGEFVRSPRSAANDLIVEAIVGVARGLGLRTIAEWVADADALERMRAAGVDCVQGFHVGRPRPVAEALAG